MFDLPDELVFKICDYYNPYKQYYDKVIHNIKNILVVNELIRRIEQAYITCNGHEKFLTVYNFNSDNIEKQIIFNQIKINKLIINANFYDILYWNDGKYLYDNKTLRKTVFNMKKQGKNAKEIIMELFILNYSNKLKYNRNIIRYYYN